MQDLSSLRAPLEIPIPDPPPKDEEVSGRVLIPPLGVRGAAEGLIAAFCRPAPWRPTRKRRKKVSVVGGVGGCFGVYPP